MITTSLILIYVVLLYLSFRMILKVKNNRVYYDQSSLSKKATRFKYENRPRFFFMSYGHKHSVFIGIPVYALIVIITWYLVSHSAEWIIPKDAFVLSTNSTSVLGLIPIVFFVPVVMILPILHSKKVKHAAVMIDMFNSKTRSGLWLKTYIILFISILISYPVMVLGINHYGYYNDEGIYFNEFFEINGDFTVYEDIDYIELSFYGKNDSITGYSYTIYYGDENITFNGNNINEKMFYEFHSYVSENSEIEFRVEEITTDINEYINESGFKDELNEVIEDIND